ncbi:hypothetical protein [Rodentibacter trehalosifermentans]|nr:hypothetical protein [Rodentibacter trehalosifermentans]
MKLSKSQIKRIDNLWSSVFAMDDRWITVKPNGAKGKGSPVKIDDEGRIVAGMGGKFKGVKISEVRKDFKGPKTPNKSSLETNKHIEKEIKAARRNAENAISSKGINELRALSERINKISNSPKYTFNQESVQKEYQDIKSLIDKRIAELESPKSITSKRLDRLTESLAKKNEKFDSMLKNHFDSVKQANGQPLNDKRNGAATFKKWDRQANALNRQTAEIERTEHAIEREKELISRVESTSLPSAISNAIQSGEITQWRKYPNRFFVKGVEKGRIIWDEKKKTLSVGHYQSIPEDQKPAFKKAFFELKAKLEGKTSAQVEQENNEKVKAKQEKRKAEIEARKALQESMKSLFKKEM